MVELGRIEQLVQHFAEQREAYLTGRALFWKQSKQSKRREQIWDLSLNWIASPQWKLDLHKRLAEVKTPHEKTALQRQISATDDQIDKLVYELYGLTEEEIKIVEEGTS